MLAVDILITLCLIVLLFYALYVVTKLCVLKRGDKLSYLKGFKKGKFAFIYFIAIFLYWIGYYQMNNKLDQSFISAINDTIDLVVLKIKISGIYSYMETNAYYAASMYILFCLVVLNVFLFAFALFGQSIVNFFKRVYYTHVAKKIYVVIGFNKSNESVLKSIKSKKYNVILFAEAGKNYLDFTYINKICYIKYFDNTDFYDKLSKLFKNFTNRSVEVIINTGNDEKNIILTEQISNIILDDKLTKYTSDVDCGLRVYAFGEPQNVSSFSHYVKKTNGCVHYLNKYKIVANDFIDKYPLTQFMNDDEIDYSSATIKEDVDLNVILIGYGKTNQQIFLSSVANNQFITFDRNHRLVDKPVNYFIYDKEISNNEKNLNHAFYRFKSELDTDQDKYLPLPPFPANDNFLKLDINDNHFYEMIKSNIHPQGRQKAFNYIVIAFGTDLENLDLAEKICSKLKEWGLFNKTKVFLKIRNGELATQVVNKEFISTSGFYTFGNESEVVYDIDKIVTEKIELMAMDRHLSYNIKSNMNLETAKQVIEEATKSWYAMHQIQRESNIYAILSIRSKLQLLGFDYAPVNSPLGDESAAYQKAYEKDDPIVYDDTREDVKGKKTIVYTNERVSHSVRENLAILEHQRWNAYMISKGNIPSTIEQIKNNDSKRLDLRRHGNITTFEGLIEFRKIMAEVKHLSEEETDVIRYDYQIMDDLVWLLHKNGYKIVKKEEKKDE